MENLLNALKEHEGKHISGEMLAKKAGITRSGVWKQIEQLRELGYGIEAVPHEGYRLTGVRPELHPFEVREGLGTSIFGREVYFQPQVDSTNRWARVLAEDGAPEGSVVLAESQTKGKGRLGRVWSSQPGLGLWVSLILRPVLSLAVLAGISLLTGVAAARAVRKVTGIQPKIKWPNDLLSGGRKLAGILAEVSGEMDRVNYLVVGIGINVNHQLEDFPEELREKAGSLRMLTGAEVSRRELLQEFLRGFEAAYEGFKVAPEQVLGDTVAYAREFSATLGKMVRVVPGVGREYKGEAVGLEEDGSLRLRGEDGTITIVRAGDVIE